VFHRLGAEMLAVVNMCEAENADTVGLIELLLHVPSTSLKHCCHLHMQSTLKQLISFLLNAAA